MSPTSFEYHRAFSRNIGWVTKAEQERLSQARVAIAGMGGVGGAYSVTLARLGVGKFNVADFDSFELHNFNRQAGACMSTLELPKVDVMAGMVADINPGADIRKFPKITAENVKEFLAGVDLYVDGIDFFAMDARRLVFKTCYEMGIPAVTAAPLGLGVSLLYFKPGEMSFEEYFRMEGRSKKEQLVRFIAGLSPAMLQRTYLVDAGAVNLSDNEAERRVPSTVMACDLCAGVVGSSALKILLGRGVMKNAPTAMQFDAYHQKLKHTWRPWGNANPLQAIIMAFIRRQLKY